jgi:hypothetical protein
MKFRFFALLTVFMLVFAAGRSYGAQSVSIERVYPKTGERPFYQVTMDFGGADDYDAHFIIGQKYAEAILRIFHDQGGFEYAASSFLRKSVDQLGKSGIKFRDMLGKVSELMGRCEREGDEFHLASACIEGMNSVFNSSRNGYSANDRLWLLIFNENQLTLRELYLMNLISRDIELRLSRDKIPGAAMAGDPWEKDLNPKLLDGFKARYIIKNRNGKNDQACDGYLGCLFGTVKPFIAENMISSFGSSDKNEASR